MALILTSGPDIEPVSLAEAKAHLRVDGSAEDTLILSLIITSRLHVEADSLTVGALVRHADLLRNAKVREGWPLLAEATTQVAHPAIRNRGTVCGSVSHNDPAAEHPGVLVTLGGTVVIAGGAGRRELAAEQFFAGTLSTALEPGEMVVELRYPRPPAGTGAAFVEFARRLGDFAIAGVAAMLTLRDGMCEQARLTIVGMGDGPFRARAAEAALTARILEKEHELLPMVLQWIAEGRVVVEEPKAGRSRARVRVCP